MSGSFALELRFPLLPATQDFANHALAILDDSGTTGIDEGQFEPGTEAGPPRVWRAFFSSESSRDGAGAALTQALGSAGLSVRPLRVSDEDWVERSQAQLRAVRIDRVVVAPPWDVPPPSDAVVVVIRPSRGFGTGHHASTRLCLRALQHIGLTGRTVVDVGTGSGVLAIAAAKLGAARAVAIDADPEALASARENIFLNGLGDRVSLLPADVTAIDRPRVAPADVVLANLTAGVLERVAAVLAGLTAPGGTLVVGGILRDQSESVLAAFDAVGFGSLAARDDEDEWVGLTLTAIARPPATEADVRTA